MGSGQLSMYCIVFAALDLHLAFVFQMQGFSWVLFTIYILSRFAALFLGDIHFSVVLRSTVDTLYKTQ